MFQHEILYLRLELLLAELRQIGLRQELHQRGHQQTLRFTVVVFRLGVALHEHGHVSFVLRRCSASACTGPAAALRIGAETSRTAQFQLRC